jgi:hypothetical protein
LTCPWKNAEGTLAQGRHAQNGEADGILGTLWHHYFGSDMIIIYTSLAVAAWNSNGNYSQKNFRTHLRHVGWDMKITDPRHTGIYYYEIPLEPTLIN